MLSCLFIDVTIGFAKLWPFKANETSSDNDENILCENTHRRGTNVLDVKLEFNFVMQINFALEDAS